ncbi:MAG TPA: LemA family protein [Candidatus Saccharimonadales bacterium]|nr:LemA family protein [Candidatus Saccharimonadales bacterium]
MTLPGTDAGLGGAPLFAAIFAVLLVVAIVGYLMVTTYNAVMALRQRIDKAWANIDVVLKQRHDQLPALVSAVRGLLAFESGVLDDVARARAAYAPSAPIPAQAATSDVTTTAVRSLLAVVEAYPDLQSATSVLDLQDEIERLESMIADRRELYNDQVYRYNTRITTWPTLPLAWLFRWLPRPFFSAAPGETTPPGTALR